MTKAKGIWIAAGVVAGLVVLAISTYQPLKYNYAIWRFESARTPEQEKAACHLVKRVGDVWEVNQIYPGQYSGTLGRTKPGTNDIVTVVEWWDGPWWKDIGQPYRAYRVLLDPRNRDILVARSK